MNLPNLVAFQSRRITTQLERSGSSPLIGYLDGIEARLGVYRPELELSALGQLLASFHRFDTLELRGEMPTGIAPSSSEAYNLLENLLIEGQWWLGDANGFFQKTPTLKSLILRNMPKFSPRRSYHNLVSWATVTTLRIDYSPRNYPARFEPEPAFSFQNLMHILSLTPRLSSLTLSPDSVRTSSDEASVTVVLSSLQHLHTCSPGLNAIDFLKKLRAPKLRTLNTGDTHPMSSRALLPFIQQSANGSRIESLTISV